MRKVASYSFSKNADTDSIDKEVKVLEEVINSWLAEKGSIKDSSTDVILSDGRQAEFSKTYIKSATGFVNEFMLTEPTDSGLFATSISYGFDGKQLAVYSELRAGGGLNLLTPIQFDVRCPKVIRSILDSSNNWQIGETPLSTSAVSFSGDYGAQQFIQVIFHPSRNIPIVAISKYEGRVLSENISNNIAKDLSGLAIVAVLDEEASWFLTTTKGKEWSCYNGAIRLYWPVNNQNSTPNFHPLWTRFSLLNGIYDVRDASYRIRKLLRRKVLGASAFSVWEPTSFNIIRKESRKEQLDTLAQNAETTDDWKQLADSYAKDNDNLQDGIEQLNSEIADLRLQINNLQLALQWQESETDEVGAAIDIPPTTVADAVEKAREKFTNLLVFGNDVNEGIKTLAPDAGPPEKIYQYLSLLAKMSENIRKGPLGNTAIQWLKDKGASCSGESETIKNSKTEMDKRTWKDGNNSRTFETHMKPNDATAPDRCVRIYFDVDSNYKNIVVGWVGRHP